MSTITFNLTDGTRRDIETDPETSVMRAALSNGVTGIVGECGGQAMCATCHVYVHDEYVDQLPDMSEDEEEMLEVTSSERDERRSRLGCQITAGGPLDRIEVDVPATQV
ncbi:2Fe-2S iron-sulfur cluster binding domain-containing protein [Corynebacterium hylobatis]|uniref:2Fe-2S iron-sulfur cluster binding domain-containing protein n=1 Tax=Corynebacterium hylobatis TaxID=1859290 RepID=A0A430HWP3_9CORY|nr:2Fe-2S iron-sulfur cluster-binding protein [Corynebacterium hylobatis]RSZ61910.1 2Fe-2S iron-sulfur cluster binding domain-containing protein [Corynebacterium hylobatis]